MIRTLWAISLLAMILPAASGAAAPSSALREKSVVVTWNETRAQRNVGESEFRQVSASHNLSGYVSSTGRVFNRLTNSTRSDTGSNEQVAGQAGAQRALVFSGQSMSLFAPFQSGGMRHITVEFDAGCQARVAYAKQSGATRSVVHSPITDRDIEFQSVTPGDASCSVRSGNVFGGG
jgi:hypothetical protein